MKPTLHEIAAMPYPASLKAMRSHYDSRWGTEMPDPEKSKKYSVRVEYSISTDGAKQYEIEAESPEQAEYLARDAFADDGAIDRGDGWEIRAVYAKDIEQ